jgi:dihydroorotase
MKRTAATLILLASAVAPAQEIYDLLLKGGHVIDPKNGRNGRFDIAVTKDRIRKIAPNIPAVQARNVVMAGDYYVTPGLIDLNASVYPRGTTSGVDPDHNTLRFGVTTVVDAGSSGPENFEQFRKDVIAQADVRVLAVLNVPGDADVNTAAQLLKKYPQIIVGVRGRQLDKTSMLMGDSASQLKRGDLETRVYGKSSSTASLQEARSKGILLDVGHGSDGLLYRIAVPAIKQGLLPDTISTGLDSRSALLPRPTMTSVLSRFLAMGLTVEQVIERTTVNPARAIHRSDIGSLEEGGEADIAMFEMRKGRFGFLDGANTRLTADRELRCVLTVRKGKVVWDTEGLSLTDWQKAGPYSNFK